MGLTRFHSCTTRPLTLTRDETNAIIDHEDAFVDYAVAMGFTTYEDREASSKAHFRGANRRITHAQRKGHDPRAKYYCAHHIARYSDRADQEAADSMMGDPYP